MYLLPGDILCNLIYGVDLRGKSRYVLTGFLTLKLIFFYLNTQHLKKKHIHGLLQFQILE